MKGWRTALPLAVGLASPDLAAAMEHGASTAVSYADLDLSKQADARRLRARAGKAIRSLCTQPRQGVLASPAEILCRRAAMVKAQAQIERAVALAVDRRSLTQSRLATAATR
ncbi:UrcA family protein [Sphingobium bisphenolivorans]|uniref:UrcA family protein n=1 Tax=Sphingobium bisphenolivorans TaxID=1335760 RepID=UPI0003A9A310|nr:UrcA family protein [Sphingobium bisphenolivorans]